MPAPPAGVPETPLVQVGDIAVSTSWVVTAAGSLPVGQATWNVADLYRSYRAIPTWAIVMTIVMVWFFFLGLLFLLVKEDRTEGFVQVSVYCPGFSHTTSIPVNSGMQVMDVHNRVNYARSITAHAQGIARWSLRVGPSWRADAGGTVFRPISYRRGPVRYSVECSRLLKIRCCVSGCSCPVGEMNNQSNRKDTSNGTTGRDPAWAIAFVTLVRVAVTPATRWAHGRLSKAAWAVASIWWIVTVHGYSIPAGAVVAFLYMRTLSSKVSGEVPELPMAEGEADPNFEAQSTSRPQINRVVVVHGTADPATIETLTLAGLVVAATVADTTVWAPAAWVPADSPKEPDDRPLRAKRLLTISEAAVLLGVGRSTAYELIQRSELEMVKIGRSARVPADAIDELVGRLRARNGGSKARCPIQLLKVPDASQRAAQPSNS